MINCFTVYSLTQLIDSIRIRPNSFEASLNNLHEAGKSHWSFKKVHLMIQWKLHTQSLRSKAVSRLHCSIKGRLVFSILFS